MSSAVSTSLSGLSDSRYVAIALLAVAVIVIMCIFKTDFGIINKSEEFTSKLDKTDAIYKWWLKNSHSPSYVDYKNDLKLESNIVEYEDVRKKILVSGGKITKELVSLLV